MDDITHSFNHAAHRVPFAASVWECAPAAPNHQMIRHIWIGAWAWALLLCICNIPDYVSRFPSIRTSSQNPLISLARWFLRVIARMHRIENKQKVLQHYKQAHFDYILPSAVCKQMSCTPPLPANVAFPHSNHFPRSRPAQISPASCMSIMGGYKSKQRSSCSPMGDKQPA